MLVGLSASANYCRSPHRPVFAYDHPYVNHSNRPVVASLPLNRTRLARTKPHNPTGIDTNTHSGPEREKRFPSPANADDRRSPAWFLQQLPIPRASEMNPANFPNVGAAAVPGVVNPGQITAQNNQVQRYILQRLQSRGPYDGWRAEVSPEERTQKTWQMFVQQYHILLEKFDPNADRSRISSLRLIHPKVHVENAVNAALTFEEKAFQEAHKKVRLLLSSPPRRLQLTDLSCNRRITKRSATTSSTPSRRPVCDSRRPSRTRMKIKA